jgi:hypothetical protein
LAPSILRPSPARDKFILKKTDQMCDFFASTSECLLCHDRNSPSRNRGRHDGYFTIILRLFPTR